jgi:V-type H+-transporting ATPase proteolipid subunit
MASVNEIYGLPTAIVIVSQVVAATDDGFHTYSLYSGFAHLAAGLCCGLGGRVAWRLDWMEMPE